MTNSTVSVAIVTGATKGFGRAVADALSQAGWRVIGNGRTSGTIQSAAESFKRPENVKLIRGDINDPEHLQMLVTAAKSLGHLKLLVNNAGTLGPSPLPALSAVRAEDMRDIFESNVIAPLRLMQLALPVIVNDNGVIINLTSDAAPEHYEGWGPYGVSKSALEKLTAVFALENPQIRCYTLDPGDMQTDMHQAAFPGEDISDRALPEESAPSILVLATSDYPSGRYRAADLIQQE
jgi:NAD(P)-dependent dehydrogenase (short-subunit alcohol dehydrogenase family)